MDELTKLVAELRAQGVEAEAFPCDLADPAAREKLVADVVARFGRLDVLINAAGVSSFGEFATSTPEILRKVTEINFFVPAELSRLAVPHLVKSWEGGPKGWRPAIVNVASICGRVGIPSLPEHCGSKHALVGLSEALRGEFARFDIDVLLVLPGVVRSDDLNRHLLRNEGKIYLDFEERSRRRRWARRWCGAWCGTGRRRRSGGCRGGCGWPTGPARGCCGARCTGRPAAGRSGRRAAISRKTQPNAETAPMRRASALPLWIGTARDARDLRTVLDAGIEAIVDLAMEEPPICPTRELVYLRFPLLDGDGNPPWLLRVAVEAVAELVGSRVPTLVACGAGMSRSPAVVAVVLARLNVTQAEDELVALRPIDVSPGLWQALQTVVRSRGAAADA